MQKIAVQLRFILFAHSLLLVTLGHAQAVPTADLIITNAKVWTVDKARPTAEAVAVVGDRIIAVGSNTEIETWRGPRTQAINAGGKLLLPGFNDAHVHFVQRRNATGKRSTHQRDQ